MKKPHIKLEQAEVRDLETGEKVFRPDIAKIALKAVEEATKQAGGEIEAPDNVVELFKDQ